MTWYERADLERFALAAGLSASDARTASYIGMAESSGNTDAVNHYVQNGQTYYVDGLWQISTINNLGSRESMRDPMVNARAMAHLHAEAIAAKKDPWSPWQSSQAKWGPFRTDIPLKGGVLGEGNTGSEAVKIPVVSDIKDAAQNTTDALAAIGKGIGKGGMWIGNPHNWLRIAYVGLGGAVVIVGLAKLVGYDAGLSPIGAAAKMSRKPKEGKTDGE
jgi:hypothetical protein